VAISTQLPGRHLTSRDKERNTALSKSMHYAVFLFFRCSSTPILIAPMPASRPQSRSSDRGRFIADFGRSDVGLISSLGALPPFHD
jgi:hypothetical protein